MADDGAGGDAVHVVDSIDVMLAYQLGDSIYCSSSNSNWNDSKMDSWPVRMPAMRGDDLFVVASENCWHDSSQECDYSMARSKLDWAESMGSICPSRMSQLEVWNSIDHAIRRVVLVSRRPIGWAMIQPTSSIHSTVYHPSVGYVVRVDEYWVESLK